MQNLIYIALFILFVFVSLRFVRLSYKENIMKKTKSKRLRTQRTQRKTYSALEESTDEQSRRLCAENPELELNTFYK